jgi:hypothetical protein
MKNISILTGLALLSLACSKETIENVNNDFSQQLNKLAIAASNYQLSPQSQAIADDMTEADLEFCVIHTSNYGETVAIKAGGVVPNESSVKINGLSLTPYSNRSYLNNDMPITWYNGTVTLTDPSSNILASIHAPKVIQASFLGSKVLDVSKPQIMTWQYDDTNPSGQVAVYIRYYKTEVGNTPPFTSKLYIVNDIEEEFDILTDLPDEVKKLNISITRGNAVNFTNGSTEKVFFNVRSTDHHEYILQ